jgi:hypothetical protein
VAAAHLGCNAPEVPRILAVDWSGARVAEHRAIWIAEAVDGELVRLEGGRSREQLVAHLLEEAERDPELVVGLDFAFSLPEWFLRARGIDDVSNAWDLVSREAEAWLRDPQPPFWRTRKPAGNGFRRTELECGGRPKSVFQLVGAGQVGTGSLRGIPFLPRLREHFAIWPFDEPRLPLLVEIYPRLHLAGAADHPNEHARDAAASALAMSRWPGDWRRLPRDPAYALEGRIWHVGVVTGGG